VRLPDIKGGISVGTMERKLYVYVPIDKFVRNDLDVLNKDEYSSAEELIITNKNPYFISEISIRDTLPLFDLFLGMNKNAAYQPFLNPHPDARNVFVNRLILPEINTIQRRKDNTFYTPVTQR
jgi:hypothetical protein